MIKTINPEDVKTTTTNLNQLIDFVEQDISGSTTRKKYQVYVTGGVGPGITSSLFHTVYDQDHSLQTANELFDITFGIYSGSSIVANSTTWIDANGKILFPSTSVMMREKINIYSQYAQMLLGDKNRQFRSSFSSTSTSDNIDSALFLNFKRLFTRDSIKRETFAMRFYQTASNAAILTQSNIDRTSEEGAGAIITDVGAASSLEKSDAGFTVGNLSLASNTSQKVGLIFYEPGLVILDAAKITSGSQFMSGTISAVGNTAGKVVMGQGSTGQKHGGNPNAKLIPDFITSASMDDVLEHFASTRFQSGSLTALTFQNNTEINSTLYFCRATADEFNFSRNPTYTDSDGRIVVIDDGQEDTQKAFTFITSVGLYDANEDLLAVAKLSRPVEKNDEKDMTFRVRLDF